MSPTWTLRWEIVGAARLAIDPLERAKRVKLGSLIYNHSHHAAPFAGPRGDDGCTYQLASTHQSAASAYPIGITVVLILRR